MSQQYRPGKKTFLSAAVVALVAAGASQTSILDQFIKDKESGDRYELVAYQDGARVWTICEGRTEGVTSDMVMTKRQCDDWRASEIGRRLAVVHDAIKVPQSQAAWAGDSSFCWNVGDAGCRGSQAFKLINAGKQADGCAAMLNWRSITRDGKRIDCSTNQPYCKGLWERRQGERELCLL